MVTPRSLTCSLCVISCPLMLKHSLFFLLSPKNIIWNFDGMAAKLIFAEAPSMLMLYTLQSKHNKHAYVIYKVSIISNDITI